MTYKVLKAHRRDIAIIVLATVPFYYSFFYQRNYIDEGFAITRNPDVMEHRWGDIWVHDFWGWTLTPDEDHWTSKSYRPLVTLSFALQAYFGHHLGFMRVVNCAIHTLNSVLVYTLINYDLLSALTFAWHPVHMENVVYLVGRADSLATTFLLLALPSIHKYTPQKNCVWITFCTVAAGLCKETGFTLPLLVAFGFIWRADYRRASGYIALFCVVCFLRSMYVGGSDVGFSYVDTPIRYQVQLYDRTLSYLMLHAKYMQLIVTPFQLSWDYSFDALPIVRTFEDLRLIGVVCTYLFLFTLALLATKRSWFPSWGVAWIVIPFVPASNLFFLVGTTVGERLLYPSTVGWAIVTSRIPKPIVLALLVWYGTRSAVRLADWRTPTTLFQADSVWDRSVKVLHQVGVVEREHGRHMEALAFFNRSLQAFDDNALTDFMIAQIQLDYGQCDEALARFHKINDGNGIGFGDHNHALLVTEFAFADVCTKHFEHAVGLFGTELEHTTNRPYLANAYAFALEAVGNKQEAIDVMQATIDKSPQHALTWINLGTLCFINSLHECFEQSYEMAAQVTSSEEEKLDLQKAVREKTPLQWIFFRG